MTRLLLLGLLLGAPVDAAAWEVADPATPLILDVPSGKAQSITLHVVDDDGRPVRGVTVTVTTPDSGPGASIDKSRREMTKVSDRRGRVEFRLTPTREVGTWDLQVRAVRGEETQHRTVPIINGVHDRDEGAALGSGVFLSILGGAVLILTLSQL